MAHTTHVAPVDRSTNGHLPFVVQAAEQLPAIASADRHIAREHPAVAAFLATERAREHAAGPVTADSVRAEISTIVTARAAAYAVQGDDQRHPRVRKLDIYEASGLAIEDAHVAGTQQHLTEDGHGADVSDAKSRYGARLGQLICHAQPDLFAACVAAAREQGLDPKRAVAELSGMLTGYMVDAAKDALKARA